jgi:hypothetical protein
MDWGKETPEKAQERWKEMTFDIVGAEEYSKRQSGLSRRYSVFLVVIDPERSEIANIIGIKVPGSYYAVKPK